MAPASRAGGRRLAIALALTIGPILVLAFLGYRIVEERERNLQLTYTATGVLVRDRLTAARRAPGVGPGEGCRPAGQSGSD